MAGGFRPRGIDLVNLLDTMVLLPTGTADGTATPAEVDLATAYTAVMGVKVVRPGGGSAIPPGSRLRVELVELPSGARQLLLEGDALAEALQELGIGSGGLAGWYEALEITVGPGNHNRIRGSETVGDQALTVVEPWPCATSSLTV